MKLREAFIESMKRAGIPPATQEFAVGLSDHLFPMAAVDSFREIEPGQEEACIKKLSVCWVKTSRKSRQKAFDFCESKTVKASKN